MEAAKSADQLTPVLTKSPSKATGMFSGTQDKCATCGKTAYPLEKVCNFFKNIRYYYTLLIKLKLLFLLLKD
uniref:LIM zinc-binding domain-containing protein n=1 Tax=Daucus carota subsp. sativus TaxID=79200 RepID=A0A161Y051_DAUCS